MFAFEGAHSRAANRFASFGGSQELAAVQKARGDRQNDRCPSDRRREIRLCRCAFAEELMFRDRAYSDAQLRRHFCAAPSRKPYEAFGLMTVQPAQRAEGTKLRDFASTETISRRKRSEQTPRGWPISR
jgi:hypothetical protein